MRAGKWEMKVAKGRLSVWVRERLEKLPKDKAEYIRMVCEDNSFAHEADIRAALEKNYQWHADPRKLRQHIQWLDSGEPGMGRCHQATIRMERDAYELLIGKPFRPDTFRHPALNREFILALTYMYGTRKKFIEYVKGGGQLDRDGIYAANCYGIKLEHQLSDLPHSRRNSNIRR